RSLSEKLVGGIANEPGYLILNPLSFGRTVTVELPKLEGPPPVQAPVRGVQFDDSHRHVTVEVPPSGYVWVPSRVPQSERSRTARGTMSEQHIIRNEFIEVHVNELTGGIARIKEFGRKPNRLSQQLALRFPRERTIGGTAGETAERTYYSQMRCKS